jgi:hypothetical protein
MLAGKKFHKLKSRSLSNERALQNLKIVSLKIALGRSFHSSRRADNQIHFVEKMRKFDKKMNWGEA